MLRQRAIRFCYKPEQCTQEELQSPNHHGSEHRCIRDCSFRNMRRSHQFSSEERLQTSREFTAAAWFSTTLAHIKPRAPQAAFSTTASCQRKQGAVLTMLKTLQEVAKKTTSGQDLKASQQSSACIGQSYSPENTRGIASKVGGVWEEANSSTEFRVHVIN